VFVEALPPAKHFHDRDVRRTITLIRFRLELIGADVLQDFQIHSEVSASSLSHLESSLDGLLSTFERFVDNKVLKRYAAGHSSNYDDIEKRSEPVSLWT